MTGPTIDRLRRASQAVYLVIEKVVADDLSEMLIWAANEIERLTTISSNAGAREELLDLADRVLERRRVDDDDRLTIYNVLRSAASPSHAGALREALEAARDYVELFDNKLAMHQRTLADEQAATLAKIDAALASPAPATGETE